MDFRELQSVSFRINSEETKEAALETIKARLSALVLKLLIEDQHEALILNARIGLDAKPSAGTYVSNKGLAGLRAKLEEIVAIVPEESKDFPFWSQAADLLQEIKAAKGGWV